MPYKKTKVEKVFYAFWFDIELCVSPIRGTRYKCANCIDFDLCEICEGSNTHVNTHVFLKIRIPIPPLANPRSALLPAFYPGNHHVRSHLPSDKYKQLAHNSHCKCIYGTEIDMPLILLSSVDQVELEALYEQFKSLSTVDGNEGGIDKETFEQCLGPLGLEKNLIIERIFAFFDRDGDNIISFPEIVAGLSVLCKGNLDEKIEYAFKGYDLDEDGYISRDELYRMYKSYFYLSMELVRDVVSAMEDEMMDTFEFSASQPVSAAFNVAIPSTAVDRNTPTEDESRDDLEAGSSTSTTNTTDNNKVTNKPKPKRYPLKEDYFLRQYEKEAEQVEASANTSNDHLDDLTGTKNGINQQRPNTDPFKPKDPKGKKAWEEKFPIMETMSQGAITEMVDKTFDSIKTEKKGYINFEEFKHCVQIDSSIVSWFEALGTVF
ncbi:hypothetical protein BDB01DRAFT_841098 [Pilobolus umbonatus]|nr:hypothetical protein BDB01DRAFT_841098 [Pilobolus umbonatus]